MPDTFTKFGEPDHTAETPTLEQHALVLYLAAIDMQQASEATTALQREHTSPSAGHTHQLLRALETAIATCYARPFTRSGVGYLDTDAWAPDSARASPDLHHELLRLRNKAYAHTDVQSGRDAGLQIVEYEPGIVATNLTEEWVPLPVDWLPEIINLAERQREMFISHAVVLTLTARDQVDS